MNPSTTKPKKHPRRWRWFVGMYFASLVVVGGAMFLCHYIAQWLM